MANEWGEIQLSRIAKLRSGFPFKSSSWVDDGVPVIKIANVKDGRIVADGCGYVSHETAATVREWMTQKGDVLIAMTGYVGEIALVRSGEKYLINQRVGRFDFLDDSPVIPEFFFYYLRQSEVRSLLETMARGSAQPNLSASDAAKLCVPVPPVAEQRAIAHILGTLDDKIELNRKQNKTLEAMARTLFKAWFVDFEPVRAKMEGRWQRGQSLPGLPAHLYDLFPDRLVESELGEIPEGWRLFAFGDVAQQGKGSVNPGNTPQDVFTHYSLPAFDSAQSPTIELGEAIKSNKTPVPDASVLVSKLNPHIPRIWHVGKAGENSVCSTEFIVWTPKAPANSAFLFCLATSQEFNSAMRQLVTGTSNSHQRVKPEQLGGIRVFASSEKAIEAFSELVHMPMEQVLQNRAQSRSLAQLRDTLLPKLISGDLRISQVKEL